MCTWSPYFKLILRFVVRSINIWSEECSLRTLRPIGLHLCLIIQELLSLFLCHIHQVEHHEGPSVFIMEMEFFFWFVWITVELSCFKFAWQNDWILNCSLLIHVSCTTLFCEEGIILENVSVSLVCQHIIKWDIAFLFGTWFSIHQLIHLFFWQFVHSILLEIFLLFFEPNFLLAAYSLVEWLIVWWSLQEFLDFLASIRWLEFHL